MLNTVESLITNSQVSKKSHNCQTSLKEENISKKKKGLLILEKLNIF